MNGLLDLGQRSGLVRRGLWPARNEALDIALDRRARHEHAVLARRAAEADVGAQPDDAPRVSAAGMRLAQRDDVVEVEREGAFALRGRDARLVHSRESIRADYCGVGRRPHAKQMREAKPNRLSKWCRERRQVQR